MFLLYLSHCGVCVFSRARVRIDITYLFSMPEEARTVDSALSLQSDLVNFSEYVGQKVIVDREAMRRNCVMCGEECPLVASKRDAPKDAPRLIMTNAAGVCTICSGRVWQVVESELEVKRCYRCHKWYPWAIFRVGEKGGMTQSCRNCRARRKSQISDD